MLSSDRRRVVLQFFVQFGKGGVGERRVMLDTRDEARGQRTRRREADGGGGSECAVDRDLDPDDGHSVGTPQASGCHDALFASRFLGHEREAGELAVNLERPEPSERPTLHSTWNFTAKRNDGRGSLDRIQGRSVFHANVMFVRRSSHADELTARNLAPLSSILNEVGRVVCRSLGVHRSSPLTMRC